MRWSRLGSQIVQALVEFWRYDMRWSYLAVPVLIGIGAVANHFMPHGWTVWPAVCVVGLSLMVHEAVAREGEGSTPLHAYFFFASALFLCLSLLVVISKVGVKVLAVGVGLILIYCLHGYWVNRREQKLIERRRKEGRCIHCGEQVTPETEICPRCLEEPDPERTRQKRIAAKVHEAEKTKHVHEVLEHSHENLHVKQREKELIARHHREHPSSRRPEGHSPGAGGDDAHNARI